MKIEKVILFDGVCNLCNGFVQFILKIDKRNEFKFASLQSEFAMQKVQLSSLKKINMDTVIYLEGSRIYTHSKAILKIAQRLGFPYTILLIFNLIPTFMRDGIYKFIANNRYKFFGKKDSCMIPTPELKSKFYN